MSTFLNILSHLPKRISLIFALFAAVLTTMSSFAAPEVILDSHISVANRTQGDTSYANSRTATYDDTVVFKVYYHNTEDPDSNKIAENVSVKVDLPTGPGETQTVTSTVKGSNTNTVVDTASVLLDRDDAYLEFISGSVEWKHNIGTRDNIEYETLNLADSVITGGEFTPIEHQKPCFEYEAWITFSMKVRVASVEVDKTVALDGDTSWSESVTTEPGQTVNFSLEADNNGNARINSVTLRDLLPNGLSYVAGSSKVIDSNNPNGVSVSDNVVSDGGINIGDLPNDTNAILTFRAKVAGANYFDCGVTTLTNTAQVVAIGFNGDEDTASVKVEKECEEPTFNYDCEALNVVKLDQNRTVRANAQISKSANVTLEGISINFGDGTVVNKNNVEHTYASNGSYTVTATVTFELNDENNSVKSVKCSDKVSFKTIEKGPETPTQLPNTGAGSALLSIFGATSAAAAAYGYIQTKRSA